MVSTSGSMVPAGTELPVPTPPEDLSAEERARLENMARTLVDKIATTGGQGQVEAVESVANVGTKTQARAANSLALLRPKVGTLLQQEKEGGDASNIGKQLTGLRRQLAMIHPDEIDRPGGVIAELVSRLPWVGENLSKKLSAIAVRYEPVSEQITVIEKGLTLTGTKLSHDNAELQVLLNQIVNEVQGVRRNAYLGELLMQETNSRMQTLEEGSEKQALRNTLFRLASRVQNLRAMEAAYQQYRASMMMTIDNNRLMVEAIRTMVDLAGNVVVVGLAIYIALQRQKAAIDLVKQTRDFLGNLLVANATAVDKQVAEIGDIYRNPVIAVDKIRTAQESLLSAIQKTDQLKDEVIQAAARNIPELNRMSGEMERAARGLAEQSGPIYTPAEA